MEKKSKKIEISDKEALVLYKNPAMVQQLLEKHFPGDFFKEPSEKITDRVTCWEAACAINGTDPTDPKFHSGELQDFTRKRLEEVATSLREGVVLSYANSNQKKWQPYFIWDDSVSGFRFDYAYYVNDRAHVGGSRLCVDTEQKAIFFGTKFIKEFNDLIK